MSFAAMLSDSWPDGETSKLLRSSSSQLVSACFTDVPKELSDESLALYLEKLKDRFELVRTEAACEGALKALVVAATQFNMSFEKATSGISLDTTDPPTLDLLYPIYI